MGRIYDRFQSAPPHGGRLQLMACCCFIKTFQSAPPHGGRRLPGGHTGPPWRFNPRPRTGGDLVGGIMQSGGFTGFNPRPRTGGDRRREHDQVSPLRVSIRAPARGAT